MFRLNQIEKLGLSFTGILRKEDIHFDSKEIVNLQGIKSILEQNGIYPQTIYRVKQEHTNIIHIIKTHEDGKIPTADGIITQVPGIALCISVADCVPIFLFDRNKRILGMIHAGREGTRKGIVQKALEKFSQEYQSDGEDIVALIGPSIGPCCYYLPDELLNLCSKEGLIITRNKTLDLWKSNEKQLIECGLKEENIFNTCECTCCNDKYYSYRRGDKKLRNYAIGMI